MSKIAMHKENFKSYYYRVHVNTDSSKAMYIFYVLHKITLWSNAKQNNALTNYIGMSILKQAIQTKCNKVVNSFMRRQICLKCFEKIWITTSNLVLHCIMLFPWIHYKIGHYSIIFGYDFFNLNQYDTRYDNAFDHRKKKIRIY